jgi:tetratricopeptide (TPR) repeat protein
MRKQVTFLFFMLMMALSASAQNAEAIFEQYLDFNFARFENEQGKALALGEKILPNAHLLPAKSRVSYYNGLAKVYEDSEQADKAIKYYEMVEKAEPTFYVAQRALGYLYSVQAEEVQLKLHATNDPKEKEVHAMQYKALVHKALPHLEKAQACDPSDETLELIKTLYSNLKDKEGLNRLNDRLKDLSKNCLDILNDQ